jgi:Ser/Thr protein kinase RdoA (MazF antagonist)
MSMHSSPTDDPSAALALYPAAAGLPYSRVEPGGLINTTWAIGDPPQFVLQHVNAIFPEAIHARIQAVAAHLRSGGLVCPRIVPAADGCLAPAALEGRRWRLMEYIPGCTYERVASPAMAREAGALVGRFHSAMLDFPGDLRPLRPDPHDTRRHMGVLEEALRMCADHRLGPGIRALGERVLAGWGRWRARFSSDGLPVRAAHGDLKVSNVRFTASGDAICLIDLDTLSSMPLACELGDALRSWCNRAGEEGGVPRLDAETYAAALAGWRPRAQFATRDELTSLAAGTWRICLELAARFGADAFHERYFGWDPAVAPGRGEHNLARAESQAALAESVERQLPTLERLAARLS